MKDIPTNTKIDKKISDTIHSLYWFNIWFAIEASRDDVVDKVIETLKKNNISTPLNILNQIIDRKITDSATYKSWVQERAANSTMKFDL